VGFLQLKSAILIWLPVHGVALFGSMSFLGISLSNRNNFDFSFGIVEVISCFSSARCGPLQNTERPVHQ